MKLTCKQQDLKAGLSIVNHAVANRSTLPILSNILLGAEQGRLKLSATNLELSITTYVDAEIQEEGSTTMPAKLLSDLVGSLPQGPVELTVPEGTHTMSVKTLRTSASIKGMDHTEYPLIPTAEDSGPPLTFECATLKESIEHVAFAAAADDSRPVLTGVSVEITSDGITFAAANAFRLAVHSEPFEDEYILELSLLIPAKTLTELARILPSDGTVQMFVTPNRSQVLFHTETLDLVSRLIEGNYPNFRNIIPKERTTRAVVETKELSAAVKSVAPFASESAGIARIAVGADSLTIEATAEDVGSNVSTISASVDGAEQQIIFNAKYLSDVLSVIQTPEVALELTTAQRPGALKPIGSTDYTYVIMPMSTNR